MRTFLLIGLLSYCSSVFSQCPNLRPFHVSQIPEGNLSSFSLNRTILQKLISHPSKSFNQFQNWVRKVVNPDPYVLLKRQRSIFLRAYGEGSRVVQQFDLVIGQKTGRIVPITCLTASLYGFHLESFPTSKARYSEFSAWIFIRGEEIKLIQLISHQPSIGAPQLVNWRKVLDRYRREGFSKLIYLHNHPFNLTSLKYDIAGTTIPSDSDLITFRNYFKRGLTEAWITNGFNTIQLNRNDVKLLIGNRIQ